MFKIYIYILTFLSEIKVIPVVTSVAAAAAVGFSGSCDLAVG